MDLGTPFKETRMPPAELQTDVPHSARIYDYVLGGKDNFEVDRVAVQGRLPERHAEKHNIDSVL
jgi:hypothetical protein